MAALALSVVPGVGLADLRFGMEEPAVRVALAPYGEIVDGTSPGGSLTLYTEGIDPSFSVYANFRHDGLLFTLEVWRPDDAVVVDLELGDVAIFAPPAEAVIQSLTSAGYVVDESEPFHPVIADAYIGLSREGGEDDEESGISRYIQSFFLAPAGYDELHTSVVL